MLTKRLLPFICSLFLLSTAASAQQPARRVRYGPTNPAACTANRGEIFFNTTDDQIYRCTAANTWTADSPGAAGAPSDATFITQTASGGLSAAQAMGALATGVVKNTTTTGVQSIATATDLEAPLFCSDAGSNDTYTCSLSPAPAALVTGTHYRFKANTANTGAATLNLNSLGATTIKKVAGGVTTDLADNDIRAGQWVDVVYDGTNFQMQSTLGNAGGGGTTINSSDDFIPIRTNSGAFGNSIFSRGSGTTTEARIGNSHYLCFGTSGNTPCLTRTPSGATDWDNNGVVGVVNYLFTDSEYATLQARTVEMNRLVLNQRGSTSGAANFGVMYYEENTHKFKVSENNSTMVAAFPDEYTTTLDPPSIAAGAFFEQDYSNVTSAAAGSLCTAGFTALTTQTVQLNCHPTTTGGAPHSVRVIFHNYGGSAVDLGSGTVRVATWRR